MMARQFTYRSLLIAAWICFVASTNASGQALGPDARPFADCERISDARRLDVLHRSGIAAVRCTVSPAVQLAILLDDTVSWPMIRDRSGPWTSLEDPVAAKVWLPNTSPLRVRFDRDAYLVIGPADAPQAIVYSAVASRTDAEGNVDLLVAVRLQPACLLAVTRELDDARRIASDATSPCSPRVRGR